MIEAYVPRQKCIIESEGCEPMRDPGVGDMLHKIYAVAKENTNAAVRIQEFMFGSISNSVNPSGRELDPGCMAEELGAIMDEMQHIRVILLSINERL